MLGQILFKLGLVFLSALIVCASGAKALDTAQAQLPPVRVYTHGEGKFGFLMPDGKIKGPGVDLLACSMLRMGLGYELGTVSMSRSLRLEQDGLQDIWFPTYDTGDPLLEGLLVGPIGYMNIYWYTMKEKALDVTSDAFRHTARVTAFPGSRPERLLRSRGFKWVEGTDDENRLLLWLAEGRVDAVLAADFTDTLKPGARHLVSQLDRKLYHQYPMAFQLAPQFAALHPTFQAEMQAALDACRQ